MVLMLLTPANRLVMRVALHTGLRVSDVLSLRVAQLRPRMTVREAKTGKSRRISLPASLIADLVSSGAGSEWCFPSPVDNNKHRTRQAVYKDVKRAAYALRMQGQISPHSARKVYAVRRLDDYHGDLARVQRALNHDDITVSMIYAMADRLSAAKWQSQRTRGTRYKV